MSILNGLFRVFSSVCSHPHTYRERRKLHGALVIHLVCERCGHAVPALQRTAREYRRATQVAERPNARVVRDKARVVAMKPRQKRA